MSGAQLPEQQTQHHRPPHYRHCLTFHRTRWLVPPALSGPDDMRYRTTPFETGDIATVLLGCGALSQVTCFRFVLGCPMARPCYHRRGPACGKSGYSLVHPVFTHEYITSQVFIILNLNGIVVFFSVCHEEC